MVKIEIRECLETENAGESEHDEVAACAQKLLTGGRGLHVHHTTDCEGSGQVPKVILDVMRSWVCVNSPLR